MARQQSRRGCATCSVLCLHAAAVRGDALGVQARLRCSTVPRARAAPRRARRSVRCRRTKSPLDARAQPTLQTFRGLYPVSVASPALRSRAPLQSSAAQSRAEPLVPVAPCATPPSSCAARRCRPALQPSRYSP
eukprot:6179210-Pleurochrysis_carterae.AAC.1